MILYGCAMCSSGDDQKDIVRLYIRLYRHWVAIGSCRRAFRREALLEASRRKVDLLVADYRLPGISGVELMRKIKARNAELK